MEPIKINIEVGLKESTLEVLRAALGCSSIRRITPADLEETKAARTASAPSPAPVEKAPAPTVEEDDLPPNDAPDPVKPTPSEADARMAVKSARDRGVTAKVIKDYMQENFGIASSVECPAERRQELIEGLSKLAA